MRIGIDLGGTKIEGVVLDDTGNELLRKRVDTRQSEGYQAILHRTAQLASYLEAEIGRKCSIGIGTPGAISAVTGTMRQPDCAGTGDIALQLNINNCKLESQNWSASIGPAETVSISWIAQIGGAADLSNGLFMSGVTSY